MNVVPALIVFGALTLISVAFGVLIGYAIALKTLKHLLEKHGMRVRHE